MQKRGEERAQRMTYNWYIKVSLYSIVLGTVNIKIQKCFKSSKQKFVTEKTQNSQKASNTKNKF